jgi:ADP-heptose:LPS heptosyltransferase
VEKRTAVFVCLPYCPDSVGEQVVQTPFFHFLREAHPGTAIVGIAPERSAEILTALGCLDAVFPYPIRRGASEIARTVTQLRRFRATLVVQNRRKSLRAALIARLATRAPMIGFEHGVNAMLQVRSFPFDTTRYIAESYAGILGRTVQEFADRTATPNGGYALLIPEGRTTIKRYPIAQYMEVAQALTSRLPVRFLLGHKKEAERREIEATSPGFAVEMGRPIAEVARIVRGAALVIANDCGPAHFAHAGDVPRVSLFDSSVNHRNWFFEGRRGRILRSPETGQIAAIPVDEILRQAGELLS